MNEQISREEHLAWCKQRALEYVDRGDLTNAMASMASDLNKHDETKDHPVEITMMMLQIMGGVGLNTPEEMRKFIEEFN